MDKNYQHIMIDLETMGTSCIAAPMSVGACRFTLDGEIEKLYHTGIDLESCVQVGMDIDIPTMLWWIGQSKVNQEKLLALKKIPLKDAITGLFGSFKRLDPWKTYFWSHGSNFDTVIIENACKLLGMPIWWQYRNVRDTRTWFDAYDYKYTSKGGHDALEDAVSQAEGVIAACSR